MFTGSASITAVLMVLAAVSQAPLNAHSGFTTEAPVFEVNEGKFAPDIRFVYRGRALTAFFENDRVILVHFADSGRVNTERILLNAEGAPLASAGLSTIEYSTAPGLRLVFEDSSGELEYNWVAQDLSAARHASFRIASAGTLKPLPNGSYADCQPGGSFVHGPPISYMQSRNERRPVQSRFDVQGDRIGFHVLPAFAVNLHGQIVIDPVLTFSTQFGGSGFDDSINQLGQFYDIATGVAVDADGNTFVAGTTYSGDFSPTAPTNQPFSVNTAGERLGNFVSTNGFVTKIDPTGKVLWTLFLGSPASFPTDVSVAGIAVDASGSIFVSGVAGPQFPVTSGAFQSSSTVSGPYVAKIKPDGTELLFSTYFTGSSGQDAVSAIALDAAGNVYIAGSAFSADFPTTPGALQAKPPAGGNASFVAKLSGSGALIFSTCYGASSGAIPAALTVDASGNSIIAGQVNGGSLPILPSAYQTHCSVVGAELCNNAFVAKLNSNGTALLSDTYLGGSLSSNVNALAIDSAGSVYVGGQTTSTDFPITPGALDPLPGIDPNPDSFLKGAGFVAKLDANLTTLEYSTFVGGVGYGYVSEIAVNSSGELYLAGATNNPAALLVYPLQGTLGGGTCGRFAQGIVVPETRGPCLDAYAAKITADGSAYEFTTYFGGSNLDSAQALSVNASGVTMAGWTLSSDVPLTQPRPSIGSVWAARFAERPDAPAFGAGGVANAASFTAGSVSPGEIVSLFGYQVTNAFGENPGLAPGYLINGGLAQNLAGTSVNVNGIAAPLFAVASSDGYAGQINFQIPWDISGATTAVITVTSGSTASVPIVVPVVPLSPGIFQAANEEPAAQHSTDYSTVNCRHPAVPGETIVIYATGLGAVDPPVQTGALSPSGPLARVPVNPSASIGGQTAPVSFAGLSPGLVGVYQINLTVPALDYSDLMATTLERSGIISAPVYLPVSMDGSELACAP